MKMRTTKYTKDMKTERELSQLTAAATVGKWLIENFTAQDAFGGAAAWDKPRSIVAIQRPFVWFVHFVV